ncbi:MAG: CBS domain-containing protein, partial [Bacteroidota bacterium]|nr:CBS domain-containing protein [Bacteroidota bacterium]
LNAAYLKMKTYDISQIPVIDNNKIVGIIDESDLLSALYSRNINFRSESIKEIMTTHLTKLLPTASLDSLVEVLNNGLVAIIEDEHQVFQGIITKIDLINYLRNEKY